MKCLAIGMATLLVGSASFAGSPTQDATAQPTRLESVVGAAPENSRARTINRADEKFLQDFAQVNAAEVNTGKLAKWKAKDAEVKAFAIHMIDTRSKTIGKVQKIAAQVNVGVEAEPDFMQKAKSAILDVSVGGSFDRAYMKATVKEHEKVIEMLEEEIKNGQDASVKQFASEALRDVQKHLKVAEDLRAKVFTDEEDESESLARNDSSNKDKAAKSVSTR